MDSSSPNHTPASPVALGSNPDEPSFNEQWHYSSIVGMLLFLANNSRPDIAFATHQCACFSHNTKQSHASAVKSIVRYLKGTSTKGLIFKPQNNLALDCYVDADLCGLWNSESSADPTSAKSRSGYVIMLCGCPFVWSSKLQTLISLSTMEAEYVALSSSMQELVPVWELVTEIALTFKCKDCLLVCTHSTVFEDNNGALTLANLPCLTSRSKHINIRTHWFCEHVQNGFIHVVKVLTHAQVVGIFTKGLTRLCFENVHLLLISW